MYTQVRGWVSYRGADQTEAIRTAIAHAAERADDTEFAAHIAGRWQFIEYDDHASASHFAFWGGSLKGCDSRLLKAQVEAVARVLGSDSRFVGGDDSCVYVHQGAFDVEIEDGPLLEWRVFSGSVHERDREEPLWEPVYHRSYAVGPGSRETPPTTSSPRRRGSIFRAAVALVRPMDWLRRRCAVPPTRE